MKSHKGADMDVSWNPWHGCKKISEGCRHCYVYRTDEKHGRDGINSLSNVNSIEPVAP